MTTSTWNVYNDAKVGKYHYGRHRGSWGVWQWIRVTESDASATFIKDFVDVKDAKAFVYKMNGWNTKKSA